MRTNKWSATVALITLLLGGGSLADSGKTRGTKPATSATPSCERPCCDCHLDDPKSPLT